MVENETVDANLYNNLSLDWKIFKGSFKTFIYSKIFTKSVNADV